KPEPTRITATGLDLYLTTEKPGDKQGAERKGRAESITGVDRLGLRSNVRMDLQVDARSGFLAAGKPADKKPAGGPAPKPPADAQAAAPRSKVVITTAGTFTFDVNTNLARFEIPHRANSHYPENVEVKREHEQGKWDQLLCDYLEIQFQRK